MPRNIYLVEFSEPARREAAALGLGLADLEAAVRKELDNFNYAHLGPEYECEMPDNGFHSFVWRDETWVVLFGRSGTVLVDAVVAHHQVEAALPGWLDGDEGEQAFAFPVPASPQRAN